MKERGKPSTKGHEPTANRGGGPGGGEKIGKLSYGDPHDLILYNEAHLFISPSGGEKSGIKMLKGLFGIGVLKGKARIDLFVSFGLKI